MLPDKWTNGTDTFEVRGNDVYRNGERVGYVSGDEIRVGNDRITIHPHDGDVYVNGQNVAYRTGDGEYRNRNDRSLWKPTK